MNNAWDCFHFATLELVRSTPIKHRLIGAYRRYLGALDEDQLPRELRQTFVQVMRSLRCVRPEPGEDEVAASVRKMSNHEADECAARIVEMFGALSGNPTSHTHSNGSLVNLRQEIPASIAAGVNQA
jgi:hypothetical protein